MRVTISHFFHFGDKAHLVGGSLRNPGVWDKLRTEGNRSDTFSIPDDVGCWQEKNLGNALLNQRVKSILPLLVPPLKRIHSYGVGAGGLEYLIKKEKPQLFLQCSDITPQAVQRLRKVFNEADDIILFDMLKDVWVDPQEKTLHLLHRVDTEFDDQEWQLIFERMYQQKVQSILFIPSQILTPFKIVRQQFKNFYLKLFFRGATFAGYLRNDEQWRFLFSRFYRTVEIVKIGDLTGYLLKLKK